MLKDPILLQLMPYVLDAPGQCKEVSGGLGATKFIHVVQDPRIHHHTHRAIQIYDAIFNASEHEAHMARLKVKFQIDPAAPIEAFNEHFANTAIGTD